MASRCSCEAVLEFWSGGRLAAPSASADESAVLDMEGFRSVEGV